MPSLFRACTFMLILGTILVSCKKEETLIKGNQAPYDPTISNLLKENYIQRAYLNLWGRQPSDEESDSGFIILNKNNCSVENRTELIDLLFSNEEYRLQLYNLEIADMLNGMSDQEISQMVSYYQNELNDPANSSDYYILLDELQKAQQLQSLKEDLRNGNADLHQAHRIIAGSPAFDDITGGGSEWVRAVFLQFLFREPSEKEMENCLEMLDNRSQTLFLQAGNSKEDLINIFFNSNEYFEGQVRTLMQRYLFRDPEAAESVCLANEYKNGSSYQSLQKKILLTNEFLGIK